MVEGMVAPSQIAGLRRQMDYLLSQVTSGQIDPGAVKWALKQAAQGLFLEVPTPPAWWRTPEQQIERARQLWPEVALPEPPSDYATGRTGVLLLHVPRPFDELWECTAQDKERSENTEPSVLKMRLAPNISERTDPMWVVFDPEHGADVCADTLWGQSDLATTEVLSAVIQFEEWMQGWDDDTSVPCLGGYQVWDSGEWNHVLSLELDQGVLFLESYPAASDLVPNWAVPSVRKC